jgi:hypothetical protein
MGFHFRSIFGLKYKEVPFKVPFKVELECSAIRLLYTSVPTLPTYLKVRSGPVLE